MPVYVQHEVLGRIPDVFNAEAIWRAPGLALFSRRPLLRDLLERSPREHKGRAATRCFSHVTLRLPQDDVDDDYHLTRGARARDLAQTLTALHQKDFGDLLGGDQVRYDVVGTDALPPGQIEVRFGHAVYLPAPDEKILYNVSVSRDSAIWQPVCPVYPQQRLALIGGDSGDASYVAPGWPFGADGAILLINDGPDAAPVLQMRPKDAFECGYDSKSGYYTIKSKRGGITELGTAARLLLKIQRVGGHMPPASTPPPAAAAGAGSAAVAAAPAPVTAPAAVRAGARAAVWQARPHARASDDGHASIDQRRPAHDARTNDDSVRSDRDPTATPVSHRPQPARAAESDATFAPVAQQRVSLVALVLPRLSRYRDTGVDALELPFDRTLNLAGGKERCISFTVNAADELYASTDAGRQRITAPVDFAPVDQRTFRLLTVAPEMAERYCATLCLAQPVSMPVAAGVRFVFGRGAPVLAALRLLDASRFLRRSGGDDGASADRLGLSRSAFSFEVQEQRRGFKIGRMATTQALYHLDEQLGFVAEISAASADAPYLLPSGHHLVAGHYVLRFEV
jgi:hypothetical protein